MTPAGPSRDQLAARLRLIVITDRALARPRGVIEVVGEALRGGAPAIQLREKSLPPRDTLPLARRLRADTAAAGALFFVNDRLDLALAVRADGVHLGPDDLPVSAARRIAPPGILIGYSADEPAAARAATEHGADYIGCGAVFPTSTKSDAGRAVGPAGLASVVEAVQAPVVAVGGITEARAAAAFRAGAAGSAVVGAVMAASDPALAARRLLGAAAAHAR